MSRVVKVGINCQLYKSVFIAATEKKLRQSHSLESD